MAVNHRILSPARLPVPPLSHKIKLRVTRLPCYYPPPEWLHIPIYSTAFSITIPGTMGNLAYRGTRPAPTRFPARPRGTFCAWPPSRPPLRRFAHHARIAARAGSSRSSATCAWCTPARCAASLSGSPAPEIGKPARDIIAAERGPALEGRSHRRFNTARHPTVFRTAKRGSVKMRSRANRTLP